MDTAILGINNFMAILVTAATLGLLLWDVVVDAVRMVTSV